MIADSAAFILGGEPMFDPTMRVTGLGIDPVRGSVPYSILYGKAWPTFREVTGALFRGDPLSKQDLRTAQSLAWGLKIPGVDQAASKFINTSDIREKD